MRAAGLLRRSLCSAPSSGGREAKMKQLLLDQLKATFVRIEDVSGGCGAMYQMEVESPLFQGKSLVTQHRMVNQVSARMDTLWEEHCFA
jgi:stress-induced morphogen